MPVQVRQLMLPSVAPPTNATLHANSRHLLHDVAWYGVLAASSMAFLSVFATRLGATPFQLALLTAGPAVVNLVGSIPFGHWLEGRPLVRTTYRASVWTRAGYLALIPLPALLAPAGQIWSLIALTLLMSGPGTLLAISFNALFADLVPPEWRAHVVGRRNALLAVTLTITALVCGGLLDTVRFPVNYQWVFALGALGAALSSYHIGRLCVPSDDQLPPRVQRPLLDAARPGALRLGDADRPESGLRFLARSHGGRLLRLDLLRGPFGGFLLTYLAFYTFQYLPLPIFPVFWVRELKLTDGAISLGSALFYVAMMVTSMALRRVTNRLGHRRLLHVSSLLYAVYPFLTWLAVDATLFWIASLLGGAVWGLLNGALVNRLMEKVPDGDRPAHMALHNLALNFGILLGSLLGPSLAVLFEVRGAMLGAAGLRLLGGLILLLGA
jgi:MFS family permease